MTEEDDRRAEAWDHVADYIRAIAEWEAEYGTLAAILPSEYADFCERLAKVAIISSARAAISLVDKS